MDLDFLFKKMKFGLKCDQIPEHIFTHVPTSWDMSKFWDQIPENIFHPYFLDQISENIFRPYFFDQKPAKPATDPSCNGYQKNWFGPKAIPAIVSGYH